MALYAVRSERMFCERLDYDLRFRWFLDLEMDEPSFDHSACWSFVPTPHEAAHLPADRRYTRLDRGEAFDRGAMDHKSVSL